MQNYMENYRNALKFNERMVAATVEYWTAWTYPAIYLAKYL